MATQATHIVVRKATEADIKPLSEFISRFVATGDLLPRTLTELHDLLPNFFIADDNGKIVGCATLEIYSRKLAEIRSLAVAPEAQGHGVGKQLVEACVELAKQHNVYEVMAISSAEEFFKKCGFDFTLPNLRKAFFLTTRDEL
ncbi:MAG: GNAT family N-acetyltransferase [Anaerolineae bacterium]